jgi:hypothetical protein
MSLKRLRDWLIGLPVDLKKMREDIRAHVRPHDLFPLMPDEQEAYIDQFIAKAIAKKDQEYEKAREERMKRHPFPPGWSRA